METIKVKRDGVRGWHWINAASFDPAKHEKFEEPKPVSKPAEVKEAKQTKGA